MFEPDEIVPEVTTQQVQQTMDDLPPAPEGYDQPAEEQVDTPQEEVVQQPKPQQPQQQKPSAEVNMRLLRESKERAERERDELMRRLEEIAKSQQPQKQAPQVDDTVPYAADDLIEGRHLSQYERKLKALEQQLQSYQKQSIEVATEARIKAQYSDFDSVVTKDNLELLAATYPELSASMHASPDLYNKAVSAYTLIKKLGIAPDQQHFPEQARMQQNSVKPRSVASVAPQGGDSPLSRANAFANGLTDEVKAQLWREMLEAQKRY